MTINIKIEDSGDSLSIKDQEKIKSWVTVQSFVLYGFMGFFLLGIAAIAFGNVYTYYQDVERRIQKRLVILESLKKELRVKLEGCQINK